MFIQRRDWALASTAPREFCRVLINEEIQHLLRQLLGNAANRPDPDRIVKHPFFAGGSTSRDESSIQRTPPATPTHRPDCDALLYQKHCREAGLSSDDSGRLCPDVRVSQYENPIRDPREGKWINLGYSWAISSNGSSRDDRFRLDIPT